MQGALTASVQLRNNIGNFGEISSSCIKMPLKLYDHGIDMPYAVRSCIIFRITFTHDHSEFTTIAINVQ
jgi:hypothetical protein